MTDDDYLSLGLLHRRFNLYATICRATHRHGFLNVRNDCGSIASPFVFYRGSTGRAAIFMVFAGFGTVRSLVHSMRPFR
jgi:hypothetical protein